MNDDGGRRPLRSYVEQLAKGKRIARFTVRVTEEEKDDLEGEAHEEGLNLSAFVRLLLTIRKRKKAKASAAGTGESGPPSSGRIE